MATMTPSKAVQNPSPNTTGLTDSSLKDGVSREADLSQLPEEQGENPLDQKIPRHANGFWNQAWVQNILPLATSLALHVGIISCGLLFYVTVQQVQKVIRDQPIIPESKAVAKNEVPGGIPHPGLDGDPTRDAAQNMVKDVKDDGFTANPANNLASAAGGGAADDETSGFLGASASGGKGHTAGSGSGQAFGSGAGGGAAPWGVPGGGGGLLPRSNFFGTGGNATKVIYLCDASGSMLGVFGALKQQLKESVNNLDVMAGQEFNVIFFSDDNCFQLFKGGMQIASADNKHKAMEFIDNAVSTGGTQPLPAIKAALAQKPELLFVLTDGFDNIASFDDVINAFKTGNPEGKMHINCIFLQSDPDPKLVEVLKQIAKDGHGDMKTILKSDMN
jgi:hypothetical protein